MMLLACVLLSVQKINGNMIKIVSHIALMATMETTTLDSVLSLMTVLQISMLTTKREPV